MEALFWWVKGKVLVELGSILEKGKDQSQNGEGLFGKKGEGPSVDLWKVHDGK